MRAHRCVPMLPGISRATILACLAFAACRSAPTTASVARATPVAVREEAAGHAAGVVAGWCGGAELSAAERAIRDAVDRRYDAHVALLQRAVDIPSGTLNTQGVRRVGTLFAGELQALGFRTRWVEVPATMHRGGHLVAERDGTRGPRLLLIGHLDTVFEGEGQHWVREDTVARGAGTSDIKGGDVAILLALHALADAGELDGMRVTVVLTGDEEAPGRPLAEARAALLDAARSSDVALAFEGGTATRAAIGRRGASSWQLHVSGRQAHSSGIFSSGVGYGAVYEGARVLDDVRRTLSGEPGLTLNVGLLAGGAHVAADSAAGTLLADGKSNIVPPAFEATGDLRFLSEGQKDSARTRMRQIAGHSLAGTEARFTFEDAYPAMTATPANARLLALYSGASSALGYPAVTTSPPESRGAGDVSFVAPLMPGIDGLGVDGAGAHSPHELIYLPSLRMSAARAAVFMSRLARGTTPRDARDTRP